MVIDFATLFFAAISFQRVLHPVLVRQGKVLALGNSFRVP
jgi:hypothetical protein